MALLTMTLSNLETILNLILPNIQHILATRLGSLVAKALDLQLDLGARAEAAKVQPKNV